MEAGLKYGALVGLLLCAGCGLRQHENLFILPDGYTGPIQVVYVKGSDKAFQEIGNTYVYNIPDSGVLCVASLANFNSGWGITRARYTSGASLPLAQEGDFDDVRFALLLHRWSAAVIDADQNREVLSDPEILFYIGTSAQMNAASASWQAEKPTFRRHLCGDD